MGQELMAFDDPCERPPTSPQIRTALPTDHAAVCALNLTEQQHTSPMDLARLRELDALSAYHKVICVDGRVAAFLLAMQQGAPYVNDNFAWFDSRYPDFLYIDRIVVSADQRGRGLGRLLYDDLFGSALAQGIPLLACEYNITPPNEASRQFHDRFGFREVGTQWVAQGAKQVSLQVATVPGVLR
jgi:predicted GNAT superfamily acetyltransferase